MIGKPLVQSTVLLSSLPVLILIRYIPKCGRQVTDKHAHTTRQSRIELSMLSWHDVGTRQENQLTRNPLRNARLQSSQLAEPLRADPGVKKKTGASELVSIKKQNKQQKKPSSKILAY